MTSVGRPWEADREFDVQAARTMIESQFSDIDTGEVSHLGSGWEFDVYATSDGWCFRFPRRFKYSTQFERESQTHSLVRSVLGRFVAVPRIELKGRPDSRFPYTFAGHRTVPGVSANDPRVKVRTRLASEIGAMLSALHSISEPQAEAAGLVREEDDSEAWLTEALVEASCLDGISPEVDAAVNWLRGIRQLPTPYIGPKRLVHNDVCPEHLLVDLRSGRLVGLIDWTDAALGDPVLDFIVLACWKGYGFVDRVLNAYVPTDPGFGTRLRFQCRVRSLHWLASSIEREADREKHLIWLSNAFGVNDLSERSQASMDTPMSPDRS